MIYKDILYTSREIFSLFQLLHRILDYTNKESKYEGKINEKYIFLEIVENNFIENWSKGNKEI